MIFRISFYKHADLSPILICMEIILRFSSFCKLSWGRQVAEIILIRNWGKTRRGLIFPPE